MGNEEGGREREQARKGAGGRRNGGRDAVRKQRGIWSKRPRTVTIWAIAAIAWGSDADGREQVKKRVLVQVVVNSGCVFQVL